MILNYSHRYSRQASGPRLMICGGDRSCRSGGSSVAEDRGFEPLRVLTQHAFQSWSLLRRVSQGGLWWAGSCSTEPGSVRGGPGLRS